MNIVFVPNGKNIHFAAPSPEVTAEGIPPAIYYFDKNDDGVFLRHHADRFKVPDVIFGQENDRLLGILLSDYQRSAKGTSAVLTGIKGTGKSLLSERFANALIGMGVPVIHIKVFVPPEILQAYGPSLGAVCFIFEEFTKLYRYDPASGASSQEKLLSFFSSSEFVRSAIILTDNHKDALNEFMANRPGRIKYHFRFGSHGYAEFSEYTKSLPIAPSVALAAKYYFKAREVQQKIGFDSIQAIAEVAVASETAEAFLHQLKTLNVPNAMNPPSKIAEVVDEKGNQWLGCATASTKDRLDIVAFSSFNWKTGESNNAQREISITWPDVINDGFVSAKNQWRYRSADGVLFVFEPKVVPEGEVGDESVHFFGFSSEKQILQYRNTDPSNIEIKKAAEAFQSSVMAGIENPSSLPLKEFLAAYETQFKEREKKLIENEKRGFRPNISLDRQEFSPYSSGYPEELHLY